MNESSGNRADSVGSATLVDNGSVGSTTGDTGNAAVFNGTNGKYFSVTNSALNIQNDFSLFFRVKPASTTPASLRRLMTAFGGSNVGRMEFYVNNSTGTLSILYWNSAGSGRTRWTSSSAIFSSTSVYTNVVVTVDVSNTSSGIIVYKDGSTVSGSYDLTAATSWGNNGGVFAIGAFTDGTQSYDGNIDEAAMWSKILTSDEAGELTGNTYPFSTETFIPRTTWFM